LSGKQIARRIAWVPQGGTDSLPFTVRQFALMSRYPWKEPFRGETTEDVRIVSRALRLAGMEPFAERPMDLLSGGERQRALIAAALAQEADILFLDEPTSFLDYRHQVETVELIGRIIRDEGRTVLLITHDINLALQCSDRILALKGGRALLQGRRDDFLNEELLSSIFETRFSFVPVP
ncbi:MAG TPA: ABC transporter ATP-binding protein, partial [Synergistaceae bacterium]|nr:ABC transporter ATP-binding protein [Synergistaceae bacterium]